ncbi:MAG: hypothetical protein SGJ20_05285, partial [Planctomycetota bacterium]|nr:hypothetical protein [Planctomycetota bacterium]
MKFNQWKWIASVAVLGLPIAAASAQTPLPIRAGSPLTVNDAFAYTDRRADTVAASVATDLSNTDEGRVPGGLPAIPIKRTSATEGAASASDCSATSDCAAPAPSCDSCASGSCDSCSCNSCCDPYAGCEMECPEGCDPWRLFGDCCC